jgi:hypothetical protein
MNKEGIKSLEELRKLDGKRVTCRIYDSKIEDCLVSNETASNGKSYTCLLQNVIDGMNFGDLKGYKYSWATNELNFHVLSDITEVIPIDDYIRGAITVDDTSIIERPDWLKDISNEELSQKPILVYYSDTGEDDCHGHLLKLCVRFDSIDRGGPRFRLLNGNINLNDVESLEELYANKYLTNYDCSIDVENDSTPYYYAVPVKKSDLEKVFKVDVELESPLLVAVKEEKKWSCKGCYFNPDDLSQRDDCTNKYQVIEDESSQCVNDEIIYKLAKDNTDKDIAQQIGEIFVGIGKEKLDKLLELLTHID